MLLEVRDTLISLCKKGEFVIIPILKFLAGVFIFSMINRVGSPVIIDRLPIVMLLGVLTAILPTTWIYFLVILAVTFNLFNVSLYISLAMLLIMLCAQLFLLRVLRRYAIFVAATVVCFYFNIPHFAVLFAGLFAGIPAILAVALGTFIWFYYPNIDALVSLYPKQAEFNPLEIPVILPQLYSDVINSLTSSSEWIYVSLTFATVIIFVNIVSKVPMNYAREIAVGFGAVICLVGSLISSAVSGGATSPIIIVIGSIISAALIVICCFFGPILDYKRAENVRFEDEENFYYMRVVPKIKSSK